MPTFDEPPPEIIEAARQVAEYFSERGVSRWCLEGLQPHRPGRPLSAGASSDGVRMSISLDIMYSQPGIYAISTDENVVFVEVDACENCHQLKFPSLQRDGLLRRGRWNVRIITGIAGPLFRASSRVS